MATCHNCREQVIFALVGNREGRPPSRMPLNPRPDPAGNVAIYRDVTGKWTGRVLGKGERALGYERLMMPHFATCKKPETPPPAETPSNRGAKREPGVTSLDEWRKAAGKHARDKRRRGKRAVQKAAGYRIRPPP